MDRPPGRGPGRRPRLGPHAPGRRRATRARSGPRHRGDVPDERPVPGDRGVVPALRDPLPARRRDPVLQPARGQGRARVPARPSQRHRQRQLRADHQHPGAGDRREDDRGPAGGVGCSGGDLDLGGDRAGRPRRGRGPRRREPGRRSPTSRRSSGGCGRGSACSTLPELLDETLEASGYRAMLADGSRGRRGPLGEPPRAAFGRRPATTTSSRRTRSTGCSRRRRSSPTRTRTRATPTR